MEAFVHFYANFSCNLLLQEGTIRSHDRVAREGTLFLACAKFYAPLVPTDDGAGSKVDDFLRCQQIWRDPSRLQVIVHHVPSVPVKGYLQNFTTVILQIPH